MGKLVGGKNKIQWIEAHRERFDSGLKDAKDATELWFDCARADYDVEAAVAEANEEVKLARARDEHQAYRAQQIMGEMLLYAAKLPKYGHDEMNDGDNRLLGMMDMLADGSELHCLLVDFRSQFWSAVSAYNVTRDRGGCDMSPPAAR